MASSRSLMACRSRSLVSLSSAAPRSRSRSSFSVVISTLSSVTCGQREGVKPRVAQTNSPRVGGKKEPRGPTWRLSSPARRRSSVCWEGAVRAGAAPCETCWLTLGCRQCRSEQVSHQAGVSDMQQQHGELCSCVGQDPPAASLSQWL